MRILILLIGLSFSALGTAQTYQYEPVVNKAEYWVSKFAAGKDMNDLLDWSKDYLKFTEGKAAFANVNSSIMTPYYTGDVNAVDFVWLDIYPNSTDQYAALEELVTNGAATSAKWPGNNVRVISSWQWQISDSPIGDDAYGMVHYQDCSLKENVTLRDAFDAYKNFAAQAKAAGDTMGRKMIFSESGSNPSFDYVYTLWNSSISKYGADSDTYVSQLMGTAEDKVLDDISTCVNGRTYTSIPVSQP
ncbi:MAG: hypothetical protein OSB24_08485 [Woeseiaceae bacterium]|nr:hypothetical protein [Woeseiaceae bacterium]